MKVCSPSPRPVNARGGVQAENSPESRRQASCAEPSGVENSKLAASVATVPVGPPGPMLTPGAVTSIDHAWVAGNWSTFPAELMPLTEIVWEPSDRPVYWRGEVHAA